MCGVRLAQRRFCPDKVMGIHFPRKEGMVCGGGQYGEVHGGWVFQAIGGPGAVIDIFLWSGYSIYKKDTVSFISNIVV